MELVSAMQSRSCCFPVSLPTTTSREYLPSLSFIGFSSQRPQTFASKFEGYYLLSNPVRVWRSSLTAIVGDTTAVPNVSLFEESNPSSNHGVLAKNSDECDGNDDIEALDDHKMTRICDKLIDVFMVDKPNTTNWRRLIAFSKE